MDALSFSPSQHRALPSSQSAISKFAQYLDPSKYSLILALGLYTGRDRDYLRIETLATSKFRSSGSDKDIRKLPNFIQPSQGLKIASAMGNSYCNLISYSIAGRIKETGSDTPFSFVHIPNIFKAKAAAQVLNDALVVYDSSK